MGLLDSVKSTVGGAVEGAAKDENVKGQVKSAVSGAVEKVAGDKVDKNTVDNVVNTAVDEAAKFVQSKSSN